MLENKEAILKIVVDDSMAPLYEQLSTKFNWELDQSVLDSLKYDFRFLSCLVDDSDLTISSQDHQWRRAEGD